MKTYRLHEPNTIKLCHVRPGECIRIPFNESELSVDLYLVCIHDCGEKRARRGRPEGLFDEGNDLFLVNLRTGEAVKMPHLSSRVRRVPSAAIVEDYVEGAR